MNTIKQYLGLVWMALSPIVIAIMLWQAAHKISVSHAAVKTNVALQWGIILLVFIPICLGLFLFGKYCWTKEYND